MPKDRHHVRDPMDFGQIVGRSRCTVWQEALRVCNGASVVWRHRSSHASRRRLCFLPRAAWSPTASRRIQSPPPQSPRFRAHAGPLYKLNHRSLGHPTRSVTRERGFRLRKGGSDVFRSTRIRLEHMLMKSRWRLLPRTSVAPRNPEREQARRGASHRSSSEQGTAGTAGPRPAKATGFESPRRRFWRDVASPSASRRRPLAVGLDVDPGRRFWLGGDASRVVRG